MECAAIAGTDLGLSAIKTYEIPTGTATGGNQNNHRDSTLSYLKIRDNSNLLRSRWDCAVATGGNNYAVDTDFEYNCTRLNKSCYLSRWSYVIKYV